MGHGGRLDIPPRLESQSQIHFLQTLQATEGGRALEEPRRLLDVNVGRIGAEGGVGAIVALGAMR